MIATMPAYALTTTPTRFSPRGHPIRKPDTGPTSITKRHLAFIRFLVHGLDQAFPRWPDIEPHTPLDTNTAADVAGLRRKNARDLFNWPIFVSVYKRECEALRNGETARSLRTMIATRDAEGAGKAADRKVQLTAAMALLGETGSKGTSVTVNNTIGVQMQPGIVIDLRDDEDDLAIDHEAA